MSVSTLVKKTHCWKSHDAAQILLKNLFTATEHEPKPESNVNVISHTASHLLVTLDLNSA